MEIDRLILHDRRVDGTVRWTDWPKLYMVDGSTLLKHCISYVAHRAKAQGGLHSLDVICHGIYRRQAGRACVPEAQGGFGLQLCQEGLSLSNVGLTSEWSGLFHTIFLHCCGAANTAPGNEGTFADGMRFCGELAVTAGAEVIASTVVQKGHKAASIYDFLTGDGIDFGKWEGPVYRFDPESGIGTLSTLSGSEGVDGKAKKEQK